MTDFRTSLSEVGKVLPIKQKTYSFVLEKNNAHRGNKQNTGMRYQNCTVETSTANISDIEPWIEVKSRKRGANIIKCIELQLLIITLAKNNLQQSKQQPNT